MRFKSAWAAALGKATAPEMDKALHPTRVTRQRQQVRHEAQAQDLPDGAFVLNEGRAGLILGDVLLRYDPEGYAPAQQRPKGQVTVLTPKPILAVLSAGYQPLLHPSAVAMPLR